MISSGYIFALLSAGAWAFAVITFKRIGDSVDPPIINLFKNTLGFFLIGATLLSIRFPIFEFPKSEGIGIINMYDLWVVIISGALGIGLADIIFIRALNIIGANVIAIIGSMFSVFIFGFSFLFALLFPSNFPAQRWPPATLELVGAILVIFAIIYSSWIGTRKKESHSLRSGILIGLSAILMMALASVLMNSIVAKANKDIGISLWIVWLRLIPGIIVPLIIVFVGGKYRKIVRILSNPMQLKQLLLGSFMATYLAISLWTVGMALESDNFTLFSVLAQTSNIFIFIMSWIILSEKITARRVVGIGISFIGITLIMFGKSPDQKDPTKNIIIDYTYVNYKGINQEKNK